MAAKITEETIRRRTVKGWAFMDLPEEEDSAIRAFLAGAAPEALPERWRSRYTLERQIAGR